MRPFVLMVLAACAAAEPPTSTPHADAVRDPVQTAGPSRVLAPPVPLRSPGDRPDVTVYGFWPTWGDPLDTVPFDQLTHLAIFDVELLADGSLGRTSNWTDHAATALALAAPYGVQVHLTVTSFSDPVQASVLGDPARRAAAVTAIADLVHAHGGHGVNVDIEGLDAALRDPFVAFIGALSAQVDAVTIDTPAVDWSGAFDMAALAATGSDLFIMGYDYHWAGGDPGPIAPLQGGGVWPWYGLRSSIADHQTAGAPADRLILGLALYGRDWPSVSTAIPGIATATATTVLYADAIVAGPAAGRHVDAQTTTPYAFPSPTQQLWYDDADSLAAKVQLAIDEGLKGVGLWALTYDDADPDLWAAIDGLTHDDRLSVSGLQPGLAGGANRLDIAGATPGSRVFVFASGAPGTTAIPPCPGATLDLDAPRRLARARTDATGAAQVWVHVPASLAGRTARVQVVEAASCDLSAVSLTTLQ